MKQDISTCNAAYYDTDGDDEMGTDIEEQGRDGGEACDVNHAQIIWQVALSGAHEEQPEQRYANEKSAENEMVPEMK